MTRSLKEAAKKGDRDVCLILAKEVVHARKTVNKLHTAKESVTIQGVGTASIGAIVEPVLRIMLGPRIRISRILVGSRIYFQVGIRQH